MGGSGRYANEAWGIGPGGVYRGGVRVGTEVVEGVVVSRAWGIGPGGWCRKDLDGGASGSVGESVGGRGRYAKVAWGIGPGGVHRGRWRDVKIVSLDVIMFSSLAGVSVVVSERQGAVVTIVRAAGVGSGVMM